MSVKSEQTIFPSSHGARLIAVKPLHLVSLPAIEREIIGNSRPMREVKRFVAQVAACQSTVLLSGESGTGKEVVARTIHNFSARTKRPFVAVNCGAVPESLIESELFGATKGGFTGATTKKGLFAAATGGTIFLDEVGEMPSAMQVKLLRVLQERKVRPVGATDAQEIAVDVRVIAATNKDLEHEVVEGRFRQDLYFRLNVLTVCLPPLRERSADVPLLTQHLLQKVFVRAGLIAPARISPEAQHLLNAHCWSGNVRELENALERLSVLTGGAATITANDVRCALKPQRQSSDAAIECIGVFDNDESFDQYLDRQQIELYTRMLDSVGGNHAEAARRLKIKRTTLHERIRHARLRLAVACPNLRWR